MSMRDRQELVRHGVLENNTHRPGPPLAVHTLHPIFATHNWQLFTGADAEQQGMRDLEWNACQPAFVLATKMISGKTCLIDYFVRLTHAPVVRASKPADHFYLDDVKITPTMIGNTEDILNFLAQAVRFFKSRQHLQRAENIAETGDAQDHRNTEQEDFRNDAKRAGFYPFHGALGHHEFPASYTISISIDPRFVNAVMDASGNDARLRRAHFGLAVTLVHELCHAVWNFTRSRRYRDLLPGAGEPRYEKEKPEPEPGWYGNWELGLAWEWEILGFLPGVAVSVPGGSAFLPEALLWTIHEGAQKLLSMKYVDQWFDEKTWTAIRNKGFVGVPKPDFCDSFVLQEQACGFGVWEMVLVDDAPGYTGPLPVPSKTEEPPPKPENKRKRGKR